MNLNLFTDESNKFEPAACFTKVVRVTYECNLQILYNQIKDLTYHGLMSFRSEFIEHLLESKICETRTGCEKFWERKMKAVQLEFNFVYPKSMSDDAIRKRFTHI
jgi:hypothetical protein